MNESLNHNPNLDSTEYITLEQKKAGGHISDEAYLQELGWLKSIGLDGNATAKQIEGAEDTLKQKRVITDYKNYDQMVERLGLESKAVPVDSTISLVVPALGHKWGGLDEFKFTTTRGDSALVGIVTYALTTSGMEQIRAVLEKRIELAGIEIPDLPHAKMRACAKYLIGANPVAVANLMR